ncbi:MULTISPECIES: hypothetical protein [unclassified Leifsonia]|uniref:hypothetical protein n=1 Tax=unclassified Leifsonia TaxID=2663824 RepID=UPI0008A735A5|nr:MULTISPECIES: hypothetical protein [unclassified Leifsonia]SEH67361.1 hypothetical protein SAMN04515694_102117 [Leifsonia sp. CL154]SFL29023.1 hypothetical protein SAMN04515692_102118 [Leifsonia sp. CL147]
MARSVEVDVERLRTAAASLSKSGGAPGLEVIQVGDLGSPRSDAMYERFRDYWSPGWRAFADSTEALGTVLTAAADAYTRRDVEDAKGFSGVPRAF